MFKKIVIPVFLTSLLTIFMSIPAYASPPRIIYSLHVQLNGAPIESDSTPPYINKATNTAYVPLRVISEGMGQSVSWDKNKQQVTIQSNDGTVMTMTIGSTTAYVNGEAKILPSAPEMPFMRVMVPIRFVSEVLGATVNASAKDGATYVDISFKP